MILDANGKKIRTKQAIKTNMAVVFVSHDLSNWEPVFPEVVPERIRDPGIMALMMRGRVVSLNDDCGPYYAAEILH